MSYWQRIRLRFWLIGMDLLWWCFMGGDAFNYCATKATNVCYEGYFTDKEPAPSDSSP